MVKVYLIRHTSLQVDSGICYGQSDIDVAVSFAQELDSVKASLSDVTFDAIYSSPLQRCHKLALSLDKGQVVEDDRLKELHFGDWEMRAWDDIPREDFDIWAQDYGHLTPPSGESFSQLQQRGLSFLDEIQEKHTEGHIAVVTHGGMIRALIAHVLNMPLKGLFRFVIDHGSVTQLEFGNVEFGNNVPRINYVNR